MSKWLKEPLVHFLLLGALLFAAYGLRGEKAGSPGEILISREQQENLVSAFTLGSQRLPTAAEFKGLLDDYIRQEIAYHEVQAMGLDKEDIIIRRRMRQKLELLAADVAALAVPTDEQLQQYLDEHAADYRGEDGHVPGLGEVRSVVQRDWFSQRRSEAVDDMYQRLAENYVIKVEPFTAGQTAAR